MLQQENKHIIGIKIIHHGLMIYKLIKYQMDMNNY